MTAAHTASTARAAHPQTLPVPRDIVRDLPRYRAGRPPARVPGVRGHKLSSNENPFDPLPGVLTAARDALRLNRYPDATALPLREALAQHHGVDADAVEAGAGSLDVLNRILLAFAGVAADGTADEVVFPWRSFESYPISVRTTGARAVPVSLTGDGRHDLAAMTAAVTERTRVVILCSPNNPTGPALTGCEVQAFLARIPGSVLVVLDEAYAEFVRVDDPVDAIATMHRHPNLVMLRTFSKAHGLADLRVGYCVAHPDIIDAVRRVAVPFGVSRVAQAAAIASLQQLPAVLGRVDRLVAERTRMVDRLTADGWRLPDAQGNFVWLPLGEESLAFAAEADRFALAVRAFDGAGVRISIGMPDADNRVLELCREWRANARVRIA